MDGQQIRELILDQSGILGVGQHGQHGGVPVVAVDHVGREAEIGQGFQNGAAEEAVLLPLREASAVDPVSEEALVVHEVDGHAVQLQLFDPDVLAPPAELDIEEEQMLDPVGEALLDTAVIGGDDARVDAEPAERPRQRPDHVGEASGLGQGRALGRGQQDAGHLPPSLFREQFAKLSLHSLSSLR